MALVVKQQDEIEVYVTDYGQIAISAKIPNEDDVGISFSKEYADLVCLAIKKSAQELYEMEDGK